MDERLLFGENLVKEYGTVIRTRALNEVNLSLNKSEFASIIGPSGCGKSTLLNMLGALDKPTSGKLYFKDREFSSMDERELAEFRNQNIGFIFQSHHLLPEFTALENVLLPTWINNGKVTQERQERAKELLEIVGLKDRMNNLANNLSGGQQQRVSIARSLINEPDLVLADEPTGNLDTNTTAEVIALLQNQVRKHNQTLIMVTHDQTLAQFADRIVTIQDGNIIHEEPGNARNYV